jgi:cation diffusion facilitator CzcD-associated flavoprotein CzcO
VNEKIETVIIGAGHAGLTMSYFLSERGLEHVIVERGWVGERCISERWDSFHFQFPNWTIELPATNIKLKIPTALSRAGKSFDLFKNTPIS